MEGDQEAGDGAYVRAMLRSPTGVGSLGEAITLSACMDDAWRVSPQHPAICVFVDERPQLCAENKALLVPLLLLGRKEAIWFYAGSQFGTKDYLGQAIGPKLSAKLLGACHRVDITELLSAGAVAEGHPRRPGRARRRPAAHPGAALRRDHRSHRRIRRRRPGGLRKVRIRPAAPVRRLRRPPPRPTLRLQPRPVPSRRRPHHPREPSCPLTRENLSLLNQPSLCLTRPAPAHSAPWPSGPG